MTCKLDFCDRDVMPKRTHGYCVGHHAQIFRYKIEPRPLLKRHKNGQVCSVEVCERKAEKTGYCGPHYSQVWNGKDPSDLVALQDRRWDCETPWCDKQSKKNRVCGHCNARRNIYGLSIDDFIALKRQCEVCGTKEYMHIDHNHSTGLFRGELCQQCNTALGLLAEDIGRIIKLAEYVKEKNV